MGKRSRDKGARGERELAKLLELELGSRVVRNLSQPRDGGIDLYGVPFALECKCQDTARLQTWWTQAVEQAKAAGKVPALAYKLPRKAWRFRIPLSELMSGVPKALYWDFEWTAELYLEAFALVCRERIEPQPGDKVRVSGVPYEVTLP